MKNIEFSQSSIKVAKMPIKQASLHSDRGVVEECCAELGLWYLPSAWPHRIPNFEKDLKAQDSSASLSKNSAEESSPLALAMQES